MRTIMCTLMVACVALSSAQASAKSAPTGDRSFAIQPLDQQPLAFTENKGQWDERVKFRANAGGITVWFTNDGIYSQFIRRISHSDNPLYHSEGRSPETRWRQISASGQNDRFDRVPSIIEQFVVKAGFVGGNPNVEVVGKNTMEYKCNYLIGNDPDKWRTDVPNYEAIVLEDVYPGIDLTYYSNGWQMEYDFVVSPGADISKIEIRYEGAKALWINSTGELVIETEWNRVVHHAPVIYQLSNGERISISGEFNLVGDNGFGFTIGDGYDASMPLIIDPTLAYSTYLGGNDHDEGSGISVDRNGNAYVTGTTWSVDFPTLNPYQTDTDELFEDVFITKLNPEGDGLIYSTYLGGSFNDVSSDIAVDGDGNAYITGVTESSDFPTHNPYQTDQGVTDAFVAKLNVEGNDLVYSTYLGGNDEDGCYGIAVDGNGNAYVTGFTRSTIFPVVNPYQAAKNGIFDAFVAKLNAVGDELIYCTYLGGDRYECGYGIAVDGNGNAYIAGDTESSDFPTHNAYQTDFGGYHDAFITKFDDQGSSLIYSTYLGRDHGDWGYGIAVDESGNVFVAGQTGCSDFPILNPFQQYQGDYDVFVTKLSADCSELLYSTFLGGSGYDWCWDFAVDDFGNACVTGHTLSSDFPTLNAYQTDQRDFDVFVSKLSSNGNGLIYSTYLGGDDYYEIGLGIAVDSIGNVYVTGATGSTDFPLVKPYMTDQGSGDAFVVKLTDEPFYLCGDADASGIVDIDDAVYVIQYIFAGGPEPVPYHSSDTDCSGGVDIDDVVYLINYIFSSGNVPCDPNGDGMPDC